MGLDMYLTARKYVSDYAFQNGEERDVIDGILGAVGLDRGALSDDSPGVEIAVNVAYWRKANAIHGWFVKNVQDGRDECQLSYVSRNDLKALHRLVVEAIRTKDATILPPTSGFFFGSNEADEWYWRDLKDTALILDSLVNGNRFDGFEFYYQASW